MADKELFNQELKTILGTTDRMALGVPGMDGCDNILVSVFIDLIKNSNVEYGSITNSDLSSYIWEYTHNKETQVIDLTMYDNEGIKISLDGMLKVTSINSFQVDFGYDITGTYTYILKYWNI